MPIPTTSPALLTDLYQLTMAQGYWQARLRKEAVFHLFFRKTPFGGGYAIASGLASVVDYIRAFRFGPDDLAYLATLTGTDGLPLFQKDFLRHLGKLRITCDVDAVPEGTAVFPQEPLLRVQGDLLEAQLLETPLLNFINFQTLIATKSARICQAAEGEPVVEFGLRRAQGWDGGLTASRAAYVGGCAATSNVLAGKTYGIPVKGTHAHSWVMAFASEPEAFRTYARVMPNNAVFLVDTYDTLQGVRHAIEAGQELRARGFEFAGIRLDSGDLAYLSIEARKLLDAAGFTKTSILASNDLDEHIITSLKDQKAAINIWGVGTKLATAYDQPALGGVYKLSALRSPRGKWVHKVKLSEQAIKISTPGRQQVRRFRTATEFIGDAIYHLDGKTPARWEFVDPFDPTRFKKIPAQAVGEDLLQPVFRRGKLVAKLPPLAETRARTLAQLQLLHPGIKRLVNPHAYPVGLEKSLHRLRQSLVTAARHSQP